MESSAKVVSFRDQKWNTVINNSLNFVNDIVLKNNYTLLDIKLSTCAAKNNDALVAVAYSTEEPKNLQGSKLYVDFVSESGSWVNSFNMLIQKINNKYSKTFFRHSFSPREGDDTDSQVLAIYYFNQNVRESTETIHGYLARKHNWSETRDELCGYINNTLLPHYTLLDIDSSTCASKNNDVLFHILYQKYKSSWPIQKISIDYNVRDESWVSTFQNLQFAINQIGLDNFFSFWFTPREGNDTDKQTYAVVNKKLSENAIKSIEIKYNFNALTLQQLPPEFVDVVNLQNTTQSKQHFEEEICGEVIETEQFIHEAGVVFGTEVTATAGIELPFILKGEVKTKFEANYKFQYNKQTTSKNTIKKKYSVDLLPGEKVRIELTVLKGKMDLPYNATVHYTNGTSQTSSGRFVGVKISETFLKF